MAFAITNIGTNTNTSGATVAVTVGAGGVPSGCVVVVQVVDASVSVLGGTVADTKGNTYSTIANVGADHNALTTNGFGRAFDSVNLATALVNTNTITYTKAISGSAGNISACYITGTDNGGVDAAVSATATGNSTTPSVTSGTPGASGELFIGISSSLGASAFTQDAAYTSPPNSTASSALTSMGGNVTNAGSGTKTYAPTIAMGQPWMAAIFAYKAVSAGAAIVNTYININQARTRAAFW